MPKETSLVPPPPRTRKTAVVTGARGGIGAAIVAQLLAADYRVIALDLPSKDAQESPNDNAAIQVSCDLSSSSQIRSAVAQIREITQQVDLLVNGAARIQLGNLLEITIEEFDSVMAINVRAAWQLAVELCALLREADGGSIVNIGSTHPQQTKVDSFPYNVSKGALLTLNKALAIELGALGIRVNSVLPGFIATPASLAWVKAQGDPQTAWETIAQAHPGARIPTADDVAAAVLFLASPAANGISGSELVVDGGRQVLRQ